MKKVVKNNLNRIQYYFFSGLALIFPIALTIYAIGFIFKFIDLLIGRYVNYILKLSLGFSIPGMNILLSILLLILIGMAASHIFAKKIFALFEAIMSRLPWVGRIYASIKRVSGYIFDVKRPDVKSVVLIEYPRKGIYALAFLCHTGVDEAKLTGKGGREFSAVFVPTSPTPWSGFTEFVPADEVIPLSISVEEALEVIVSGGVMTPAKWVKEKSAE